MFGFLGPNGAGKTSTIRMLTGISRATKGSVRVLGEPMSPDDLKAKHKIGYMPEMPGFYPAMKAIDHLIFWADFYHIPKAEARKRGRDLLASMGLAEHADRKARTYSHGMKKRLALCGALLHEPDVLILDEPSGGLDPEGTIFFRSLMEQEKRKGRTIFLSSHLLPEIQLICSRVGILNRGKLIAVDTVRELERKVSASAPPGVHINCPPLSPEHLKAVESLPGVAKVETQPFGIVVTGVPGAPLGATLNRALMDAGVPVEAIYPIIPTLEDVFLKLIEAKPGGAVP